MWCLICKTSFTFNKYSRVMLNSYSSKIWKSYKRMWNVLNHDPLPRTLEQRLCYAPPPLPPPYPPNLRRQRLQSQPLDKPYPRGAPQRLPFQSNPTTSSSISQMGRLGDSLLHQFPHHRDTWCWPQREAWSVHRNLGAREGSWTPWMESMGISASNSAHQSEWHSIWEMVNSDQTLPFG